MKAIVLTCDRYRALTEHMIIQYERLWPDHPFVFRIPYQSQSSGDLPRTEYVEAPGGSASLIPASVLKILSDIDDEEMVYWCPDDKYPIQLVTAKIATLMTYAGQSAEISGLMFCRCRAALRCPEAVLYPREWETPSCDILLERRAWNQIWIHQFIRAKVLRHFFSNMPEVTSAKGMDDLHRDMVKPADYHLFVTKQNFAVFGESTQRGRITMNCYESIRESNIALPEAFQNPNPNRVTMGAL